MYTGGRWTHWKKSSSTKATKKKKKKKERKRKENISTSDKATEIRNCSKFTKFFKDVTITDNLQNLRFNQHSPKNMNQNMFCTESKML